MSFNISQAKLLSIRDQIIFEKFLKLETRWLSPYNFANIFIWRKLYKIFWHIIQDCLCIFFKDAHGCFMYLPPLGEKVSKEVVEKCFSIMDEFNANKQISRIENVELQNIAFYQKLGFIAKEKPGDYLCLRQDLANLKGNKFKSKRSAYNYFVKNHKSEYCPYRVSCKNNCLLLCRNWMRGRKRQHAEPLFQGMLEDSFASQKQALNNFAKLKLLARVVKVDKKIVGYTFGYELNPTTFCVLFEVCNLNFKGIAQHISRQLCLELTGYKYINIMDDSDLDNLRRVKMSYKPLKIIPNCIIRR